MHRHVARCCAAPCAMHLTWAVLCCGQARVGRLAAAREKERCGRIAAISALQSVRWELALLIPSPASLPAFVDPQIIASNYCSCRPRTDLSGGGCLLHPERGGLELLSHSAPYPLGTVRTIRRWRRTCPRPSSRGAAPAPALRGSCQATPRRASADPTPPTESQTLLIDD